MTPEHSQALLLAAQAVVKAWREGSIESVHIPDQKEVGRTIDELAEAANNAVGGLAPADHFELLRLRSPEQARAYREGLKAGITRYAYDRGGTAMVGAGPDELTLAQAITRVDGEELPCSGSG